MNGYVLSTEATEALMLKHQIISTHSFEQIFIVLDQFDTNIYSNVYT